ncbi:MAG: 1,2-phenylacetyl-CoA epoxidase subunit B [Chitinophagaceae bacterium]|nr:MAG: 1,2-phenylacetyl-CoA epoxidase subunit B [Chitinophagaceae bacterium]
MNNSYDPRVKRLTLKDANISLREGEHWNIFEVFRQDKRGARHVHVGALHAPDPVLALIFAKEQYGRRKDCFNLWVVCSADILAFNDEDSDVFANNREKNYRDASGFKVRDKIEEFRKKSGNIKK